MQNSISWVPFYNKTNFVTTEPIFKIRNSANSYCLAESHNDWYGHHNTSPYLLCAPAQDSLQASITLSIPPPPSFSTLIHYRLPHNHNP